MVPSWRRGPPNPPHQDEEEEQGHGSIAVLDLHRYHNRISTSGPRILLMLLVLLVFTGTILLGLSSGWIASSITPDVPLLRTWHNDTRAQPSNTNTSIGTSIEGTVVTPMEKKQLARPPSPPQLASQAAASRPHDNKSEKEVSTSSSSSSDNKSDDVNGPYHNLQMFTADYQDMLQNMKIYVYPTAKDQSSYASSFPRIFQPLPNPSNPNLKLGNYFSEHAFKTALFQSPLLTLHPEEAQFFFMPFSINAMRNDQRLHSGASIVQFVTNYTSEIGSNFPFWNASGGSDHFYVCCHSIGREAASKHHNLHNNAIQVTCSSSYFQKLYVTHKDVPLAQVWPRRHQPVLDPPHARNRLVFFVGRKQNSLVRQRLLSSFGKDTSMDIFSGNLSFPYEEGFQRSRYCLHVKGYEVNTARISDAIHYGCIPVIISDYYDLPFANVLDWSKFSIIISQNDIDMLKDILLSISTQAYITMYQNLCLVRRHFAWHMPPQSYDSFFMTTYQLWLRRGLHRLQNR